MHSCKRCNREYPIRETHKTTPCPVCPGAILSPTDSIPPFKSTYINQSDLVDERIYWPIYTCTDYTINAQERRRRSYVRCKVCFHVARKSHRHHNEPCIRPHEDMLRHRARFQPSLLLLSELH